MTNMLIMADMALVVELAFGEGRGLVLQLRIPVLGLVDAAGFLGQRVAGEGIGAGAGAAADLLVFAPLVSAMGPTVGGNGP